MSTVKLRSTEIVTMHLTDAEMHAFDAAAAAAGNTMGEVLAMIARIYAQTVQAKIATKREVAEALKNLGPDNELQDD